MKKLVTIAAIALLLYCAGYGVARWRKCIVMREYDLKEKHLLMRDMSSGHDIRDNWRGALKNKINPALFICFRPLSLLEICLRGSTRPLLFQATPSPPRALPRFKAQIICFNGALDHSSSCSGTNYQPDGTPHTESKMTCGFLPDRVSEITWSFSGKRGDEDVYQFCRRFPMDAANVSTSSKEIEFSDHRVIVFQDEFQTVVIEPPEHNP